MASYKKLVIGLKGVKGVDRCVDWFEPVPVVGNYHETYIYLPSLNEKVLKKMLKVNPDFFGDLREEIFEALKANLAIYCVISQKVEFGGLSSYDFLPFTIRSIDRKVETFDDPKTEGYLSNVQHTDCYFERTVDNSYLASKLTSTDKLRFFWKFVPFLESLHKKSVAFAVKLTAEAREWTGYQHTWEEVKGPSGSIVFLPPTTKIDPEKGLKLFIKGKQEEAPSMEKPKWFSKIVFPNEKEMSEELKDAVKQKDGLEKKISMLQERLQELEGLKWALRLKDKSLENAVDKIFDYLGISLIKGEPNQEDRWLEVEGNRIPIEVKGHEQAMRRKDLRQIIDRTAGAQNSTGKTVGILIGNPYCETSPGKRPSSFDDKNDKIVSGATSFDVALIDTLTLIELVKRKMGNEKGVGNQLVQKLLTTIGIVVFPGKNSSDTNSPKESSK